MTALLDAPAVFGRETPRLMTQPLRPLTPETTLGFEAAAFAEDVLGVDLLPWQRWWLLHALELHPDGSGRYRFRTVLTLVGRQQGKTTLLKIVALWALYMGHAHLVLGAAQSLDIARESWQGAVELAEDHPDLSAELATVRRANGEQCLTLTTGARYRITAATRSAGRGLSVDLLILDEIREQRDWAAWGALSKTTIARPAALTVGISNAGDDQSVVLNALRSAALSDTDDTLGLFEWSAPDGCELDDVDAWAQACPGLGRTITISAIRSALATDPPSVFRTELLCQHVATLDDAVDMDGWRAGESRGTLAALRHRMAVCLDVAPDGQHVTAVGVAPLDDGRFRCEVLGAWTSTEAARGDLPALFEALRPRAVGWFPSGPAAVLGADLAELHGVTIGRWNVQRTEMLPHAPGVVELTGQRVPAACQSLADIVQARRLLQPNDPLLNAHVGGATRMAVGDGWRFARRAGHVDGAYALAGALDLARSLPADVPPPRSQVF